MSTRILSPGEIGPLCRVTVTLGAQAVSMSERASINITARVAAFMNPPWHGARNASRPVRRLSVWCPQQRVGNLFGELIQLLPHLLFERPGVVGSPVAEYPGATTDTGKFPTVPQARRASLVAFDNLHRGHNLKIEAWIDGAAASHRRALAEPHRRHRDSQKRPDRLSHGRLPKHDVVASALSELVPQAVPQDRIEVELLDGPLECDGSCRDDLW